jgi:acyl carrier protein
LDPERIDAHRSVNEFGMDSLMAMELAVSVEKRLGVQLPVMLLGEGPSITRLAERLVALLRAPAGQEGESALVEESVRTVAAIHGQTVDDQALLAEVVASLAAGRAADHKA